MVFTEFFDSQIIGWNSSNAASVGRSSEGKTKITRVFSLNKIKPGMILNQWPNVSYKLSVISVKVKGVGG